MPVPTLLQMAQSTATKNINALQDVGDISYELVRPILKQVKDPQQLRHIEINSPHIGDHDAELWKAFIVRDISNWEEKIMEPKNPRSWWKVYRKLLKEERRANDESEEQLKAQMLGLGKQKEANQAQIVHKVIPQTRERGTAFVDGQPNSRINSSGTQLKHPNLKNSTRGKDILSAIRKQSSNAQRERGMTGIQPTKALLPGARSQIRQAPEGMLRDHTRPAPAVPKQQVPSPAAPRMYISSRPQIAQDMALKEALKEERTMKEDRLRALASGKTIGPKASSPSAPAARVANTGLLSPATSSQSQQSQELRKAPTTFVDETLPSPAASAPSQERPKPMSPAQRALSPAVVAGQKRKLSPSPAPQMRRPATPVNIFMPSKKRKP